MELEVPEPYSFHSAKVTEMLLLCLPASLKWHTVGIGLFQETFFTKNPVDSFLKP